MNFISHAYVSIRPGAEAAKSPVPYMLLLRNWIAEQYPGYEFVYMTTVFANCWRVHLPNDDDYLALKLAMSDNFDIGIVTTD